MLLAALMSHSISVITQLLNLSLPSLLPNCLHLSLAVSNAGFFPADVAAGGT